MAYKTFAYLLRILDKSYELPLYFVSTCFNYSLWLILGLSFIYPICLLGLCSRIECSQTIQKIHITSVFIFYIIFSYGKMFRGEGGNL